jgi:hypothetical protein
LDPNCTHTLRRITSIHKWKANEAVTTYRLRCRCCGHTWKIHYDKDLNKEVLMPARYKTLTNEQVRFALTDPRSAIKVAEILHVSHQSICQIRNGDTHKELFPDIPRRVPIQIKSAKDKTEVKNRRSCRDCQHWWKGNCDLDIPESGGAFASECSCFEA